MKNRVITISREFGSGGRTIGKQVAEKLRIPCYDNELLTKIAEESGFQENYIKEAGEYAPGGFLSNAFSHRGSNPNNADYLWQIQYKIISELAEKGPLCRLYPERQSGLPEGLYSCKYGLPCGTNRQGIW